MTARWSNVVVATFAAPVGAVQRYIPGAAIGRGEHGQDARATEGRNGRAMELEVDVYGGGPLVLGDGRPAAAVSLVGRSTSNVRLLGVRWPRLTRFESVSLRICVREKESGRRGVVYVREVVSSRVVAWLLRRWYNHPCVTAEVEEEVKQQTLLIGAEYRLQWPTGGLAPGSYVSKLMETTEQMVRVVGTKPATRAVSGEGTVQSSSYKVQIGRDRGRGRGGERGTGSGEGLNVQTSGLKEERGGRGEAGRETLETWLTERPFVFGLDAMGRGSVHEVIHPSWGAYPAVDSSVRVDFASMFGADLGFLSGMTPAHVMLAVGSEVAMFPVRGAKAGVRWGVKRG